MTTQTKTPPPGHHAPAGANDRGKPRFELWRGDGHAMEGSLPPAWTVDKRPLWGAFQSPQTLLNSQAHLPLRGFTQGSIEIDSAVPLNVIADYIKDQSFVIADLPSVATHGLEGEEGRIQEHDRIIGVIEAGIDSSGIVPGKVYRMLKFSDLQLDFGPLVLQGFAAGLELS
ncbi:hypothetical protein [Singulisphaera sp. GP187]|uniref:hypothetical protein n=1 Tax=Singulisphaera sp. GP187 TaxID=1882752 RepID=UPI0013564795|nr:hypothetical protein [Singulisphaera sp. GP187]